MNCCCTDCALLSQRVDRAEERITAIEERVVARHEIMLLIERVGDLANGLDRRVSLIEEGQRKGVWLIFAGLMSLSVTITASTDFADFQARIVAL